MQADLQYTGLIRDILTTGDPVSGRNGGTRRVIGRSFVFDSFPLISVRRTAWKNALREWEWFMSGSNRLADLHSSVQKWWQPWADPDGHVWHNYSRQFRAVRGHVGGMGFEEDQLEVFVEGLKEHPHGRRHVLTTWNPVDMHSPKCKITSCHGTVIQAFVSSVGTLSLFTYHRSVDVIVGMPHNWVQYWAFLVWLAARLQRKPGWLEWVGGDCHIYDAHADLAGRIAGANLGGIETPHLLYTPEGSVDEFRADDWTLVGNYRPIIDERAEMVV